MPVEYRGILQSIRRHELGSDGLFKAFPDSNDAPCTADLNEEGDFTIYMHFVCSLPMAEGSTLGMTSSLPVSISQKIQTQQITPMTSHLEMINSWN